MDSFDMNSPRSGSATSQLKLCPERYDEIKINAENTILYAGVDTLPINPAAIGESLKIAWITFDSLPEDIRKISDKIPDAAVFFDEGVKIGFHRNIAHQNRTFRGFGLHMRMNWGTSFLTILKKVISQNTRRISLRRIFWHHRF